MNKNALFVEILPVFSGLLITNLKDKNVISLFWITCTWLLLGFNISKFFENYVFWAFIHLFIIVL